MKNIEQELKIQLSESEYNRLLSLSDVAPVLQTNYYFYCENMSFDTVARIRKKGDRYLLCYKKLLKNADGVNVCDERELNVDKDFANVLLNDGITVSKFKQLLDVDVGAPLYCVGKLDTYRAKYKIGQWTVELDKNEYLDVTDYELECESEQFDELQRLKNYLYVNYGVEFKPSTAKSGRFFKKYFDK